jgi:hypothetical protein
MQRKFNISLGICTLAIVLFSSCLKHDLPKYPVSGLDFIDKVYFQYRWLDSNNISNGQPVVAIENLNVTQTIDSVNNVISLQIQVPAANGDFDAYQHAQVSLKNLWALMDISQAATIAPVDSAPVLGYAGDFSTAQKYTVTAANPDSSRVWTITVTSFTKP